MGRHFVRALLVLVVLGLAGTGACIIKSKPGHGHRHHPSTHKAGKHKKHKKHRKARKHKKHKKRGRGHR